MPNKSFTPPENVHIQPKPGAPENLSKIKHSQWFCLGEVVLYKDYQGEYFKLVGECHIEKAYKDSIESLLKDENEEIVLIKPTSFSFREL